MFIWLETSQFPKLTTNLIIWKAFETVAYVVSFIHGIGIFGWVVSLDEVLFKMTEIGSKAEFQIECESSQVSC